MSSNFSIGASIVLQRALFFLPSDYLIVTLDWFTLKTQCFLFTVVIKSCSHMFTSYRTYQNHNIIMLMHKHKQSDENNVIEDRNEVGRSLSIGELEEEESSGVVSEHHDTVSDLTLYCGKWILKTSETRKLTRTALVGIIEDIDLR